MRHYGYIDAYYDNFDVIKLQAQQMSGYPIGIMLLNVGYPIVPGNVANATTYNFPVRYAKVKAVDSPRLHTKDPTIIDDLTALGKELQDDGVRAIICACGYFGRWQKQLTERLDVPVYASSLTQIPMIKTGLKKGHLPFAGNRFLVISKRKESLWTAQRWAFMLPSRHLYAYRLSQSLPEIRFVFR